MTGLAVGPSGVETSPASSDSRGEPRRRDARGLLDRSSRAAALFGATYRASERGSGFSRKHSVTEEFAGRWQRNCREWAGQSLAQPDCVSEQCMVGVLRLATDCAVREVWTLVPALVPLLNRRGRNVRRWATKKMLSVTFSAASTFQRGCSE